MGIRSVRSSGRSPAIFVPSPCPFGRDFCPFGLSVRPFPGPFALSVRPCGNLFHFYSTPPSTFCTLGTFIPLMVHFAICTWFSSHLHLSNAHSIKQNKNPLQWGVDYWSYAWCNGVDYWSYDPQVFDVSTFHAFVIKFKVLFEVSLDFSIECTV